MASEVKCIECGSRYFNKMWITSEDSYKEQKDLVSMINVENGLLNWKYVELFVYSCEMCKRVVFYTEEKEVETMEEEKERESPINWYL